jgi:hypothetical protein
LDPRPNRDPTSNDRTPKGTERRIGLNTKFERRKTERRKSFSQFPHAILIVPSVYEGFLSSVVIPQVGSFDPTWGMTTELWESDDPQLGIRLSTLNLNFELWKNFFK